MEPSKHQKHGEVVPIRKDLHWSRWSVHMQPNERVDRFNFWLANFTSKQCEIVETVFLRENALHELPIELRRLKNLRHLYLARNCLVELPLWLCKMTTLEWLTLNDNDICRLPVALGQLTRLKSLILHNNAKLPLHLQVRMSCNQAQVQHFLRPFRCAIRCQKVVIAMLGTYRQWRALRLPRDMVRMLARTIWDMRADFSWSE